MNNSEQEKYLRDFVTLKDNSNKTLIPRKSRAFAILVEIMKFL